jgi:hypothetical protein
MADFSRGTKLYLFGTMFSGGLHFVLKLNGISWGHLGLLALACLAAIAQVFKVSGPTERSNYNLAWFLYGFALVSMGVPAALFVILVAHLVEWAWHRYPWYIQVFNIASYGLVTLVADLVYRSLNPSTDPLQLNGALALVAAFGAFTLLNHLLVGLVIRLARGQSLAESGVLDFLTLAIDFTLLGLGAAAALVWMINPWAVVLNAVPLYLLYQGIQAPALRRRIAELEAQLTAVDSRA